MMSELLIFVQSLKEKVAIPKEISDPYFQLVWNYGKNAGTKYAREAVRHRPSQKLIELEKPPKFVVKCYGPTGSAIWMQGYNAPISLTVKKVNDLYMSALYNQYTGRK